MIGPKTSTVFKSRWNALFWSLGILLTVYVLIPSPQDHQEGADATDEAVDAMLSSYGVDQDTLDRLNR